ncbi:MAG: CvpA family protein [Clostridia bacterium]|nr:CvpA family protein [Clostridia bacterium]
MLRSEMDLAVLTIVGIFAFLGWKNGLVKMGFRLVSHLAALVLAWVFHPYLAAFLQKTPFYESLFSSVAEKAPVGAQSATEAGFLQQMLEEGTAAAGAAAAEYFARLLLNGVSFLLILVLARILLFFAGKILHFVASLPVLGLVNRLAGMAIGLLEGLLIVCVLLAVCYVAPPLRDNKPLGYAIEQSMVTRSLYRSNPILKILTPKEESSFGK